MWYAMEPNFEMTGHENEIETGLRKPGEYALNLDYSEFVYRKILNLTVFHERLL